MLYFIIKKAIPSSWYYKNYLKNVYRGDMVLIDGEKYLKITTGDEVGMYVDVAHISFLTEEKEINKDVSINI